MTCAAEPNQSTEQQRKIHDPMTKLVVQRFNHQVSKASLYIILLSILLSLVGERDMWHKLERTCDSFVCEEHFKEILVS
jgi:hypothetical protein